MAFVFPTHIRNNDGTYGPTTRQHYYKPIHYHARTARQRSEKNRWCLREGEQYEVFRIADDPWWECILNRCLFSIVNSGKTPVGMGGERLAKFPLPRNSSDPYHGFPILTDEDKPGPALLDLWESTGIIPYHVRMKIEHGKI